MWNLEMLDLHWKILFVVTLQGSTLGPLLFAIYMNDICNVSNILKFVLFADDTNIFTSDRNVAKQCSESNRDLNKLYTCFV